MKGKELLRFHEGVRLKAYKDSLGYWTVGIGHLLPDPLNPKWDGYSITAEQCEKLFDNDIKEHFHMIQVGAKWALEFDEVRKYVILDMTYNLSIEPFDGDGFKDWPIFVRQLKAHDWKAAAANMRSTKWASQVKGRAERLARMIETGQWPNEVGVPKIV